ncbi:MAG: hypothetical protein JNG84_05210 [Archangium sp.]|nr:hypothetical protein [Archangium sp.]
MSRWIVVCGVAVVLSGCGVGPMTGGDAGTQLDSGVSLDGGSDPHSGSWMLSGPVTSQGGSVFQVQFVAQVTRSSDGGYHLLAGQCDVALATDATASQPTLRALAGATTSCSPSFLSVAIAGSPLTLDTTRPVRIDVSGSTLVASGNTVVLSGSGSAGYADSNLTMITFSLTGAR